MTDTRMEMRKHEQMNIIYVLVPDAVRKAHSYKSCDRDAENENFEIYLYSDMCADVRESM